MWTVIVFIMLFDLFLTTFGVYIIDLGFSISVFNSTPVDLIGYLRLSLPAAICVILVMTKQRRLLWTALIPSVIQFVFWMGIEGFYYSLGGYEAAGLWLYTALFHLLPVCVFVAIAYLYLHIKCGNKQNK
jgi:hypothetical protein